MIFIKYYGILLFSIICIGDLILMIVKDDKLRCFIELCLYLPILFYLIEA